MEYGHAARQSKLSFSWDINTPQLKHFSDSKYLNLHNFLDQILVRIKENLEYDREFDEDQEKDWKSICFWENKVACIRARDSAETLDNRYISGTAVSIFKLIAGLKNKMEKKI